MISETIIKNCIEEAGRIAGVGLAVFDSRGSKVCSYGDINIPSKDKILSFCDGDKEDLEISGQMYIKVRQDDETQYVLAAQKGEGGYLSAYLTAAQLRNLIGAYSDRVDRNSFFRNLLLDDISSADVYNKAGKLHIDASQRRCVFVIEQVVSKEIDLIEMVRELFYTEAGDYVTAVDEDRVVVIKTLSDDEGEEELEETADMLVDMAGSEAMSDVRVAYGNIADDIRSVPASYREASMALEVIKIFYPLKRTAKYSSLGVGRLIYQLPVNLCQLFVKEIFGDDIPEEIDEEVLTTVNRFFENSLNVSETSRQLFIHRNTLIYRIEKLQKATGLDVRVFDDALTLKIALMVVNYMKHVRDHNPRIST